MKNIPLTVKKIIRTFRVFRKTANTEFGENSRFLEKGIYKANGTLSLFYNKKFKKSALFENRFITRENCKKSFDSENDLDRATITGRRLASAIFKKRVSAQPRGVCGQCLVIPTLKRDIKIINYRENAVYTVFKSPERLNDILNKRDIWRSRGGRTVPIIEINRDKLYIKEELIKKSAYKSSFAYSFILDDIIKMFENNRVTVSPYRRNGSELKEIKPLEELFKDDSGKTDLLNKFKMFVENSPDYKMCLCHGDLTANNLIFNGDCFYYIDFERVSEHFFAFDMFFYIFQETFRFYNTELINDYLKGKYDEKLERFFSLCKARYDKDLKKVYLLVTIFEIYGNKLPEKYFNAIFMA